MQGHKGKSVVKITGLKTIYNATLIKKRVSELGTQIDDIYGDTPLVIICVLRGACIFFSDLVRCLHNKNLIFDFIRISSYGDKTTSGNKIHLKEDISEDVSGKNVLIVEDIVDSGQSMRFILEYMHLKNALSVKLVALIDKQERRKFDISVDFVGFKITGGFVVGYGLDYAGQYRALPDLCCLEFSD